jgi:hypothetical protein
MFSKKLTTFQHKKNKQHKKTLEKQIKKKIEKNEIKLLLKLGECPEDVVKLLYSYLNNNIKFNLSFYKEIFHKFIYPANKNNKQNFSSIFKGYPVFNYCTYDKTALPLKEMLKAIPLDKLQKYVYFGTPSKYFNIAFPKESSIIEYISDNYAINDITSKEEIKIKTMYKNYIFEILDLISYFSTKANEYHSLYNENNKFLSQLKLISSVYLEDELERSPTKEYCEENEKITRKLILSVLFIYEKYGRR